MRNIVIILVLFTLAAGICFGQYTVAVLPVIIRYPNLKSKPLIEPETLTQMVEASVAKLGYTLVDRTAVNNALEHNQYRIINARMGREMNADFIIEGRIDKSEFNISVFDVQAGILIRVKGYDYTDIRLRNNGKDGENIDAFLLASIGSANVRQVYQQELAQIEASPETEAWKNKNIYMSTGIGGGFNTASVNVGGEEYGSSGGAFGGSIQFDFGKSRPKMSKKGTYSVGYSAVGIGLTILGSGGNVGFWMPIEWRGATRFKKTEIAGGVGLGFGFGGGFSYGFCTSGSIGFKAGNGIIFIGTQLNAGQAGTSGNAFFFSGSGFLGYKFGF